MAINDNDRATEPQPQLLARLARLNPTLVVVAVVGLFLGVLLLPDRIGAALVLVIAAGLGGLLIRTWPVLPTSARALRVGVLILLVLVAFTKAFL